MNIMTDRFLHLIQGNPAQSQSSETAFKKAPKEQVFRTKRNYIEEKLVEIDKKPTGDFMDRVQLLKRLANINEF